MKKFKPKRDYDRPIRSRDHAVACRAHAVRRYGGKLIRDQDGMLLVEDGDGVCHTDEVLRALSFFGDRNDPPREKDSSQ
jgi:hypothetical protein